MPDVSWGTSATAIMYLPEYCPLQGQRLPRGDPFSCEISEIKIGRAHV